MYRETNRYFRFDWITIIIFLLLVGFGWLNILSASHVGETIDYFDFSQPYGKQLMFIALTVLLIILILSIESKFYERFSSIIYIVSMLSLVGLFIAGKNVNGATSWYAIGGMTIQPSEFAKAATALAVAKFLSDLQTDIKNFKDQIKAFIIIAIPAILILLQNDAGSTVVYASFFFVFYREGLPKIYLTLSLLLIFISVSSLKFGATITGIVFTILILAYHFTRRKKPRILQTLFAIATCLVLSFGIKFFYQNILQPHQQDRISLWLRLEKDPDKIAQMRRDILYNLYESEKAISSGGLTGKGFLEGTRTTGKFVPEQHTDYIFSTVGEEWGFAGTTFVVVLFVLLLLRILHLSELQKSQFSRVYGYSVASILFFHFMINIGMVMGLIPTIGIPLPFFSYGGSGLWGFTILLFIFIKLDSNRINEW
ncbi:MAG: rod shape-determining protein RodA [Xanthomarina sp.]|uniref:Rod shape-determining protein RodA n=1 Tax=Xanthomarina gelatinilytica TaxID=1137281 RepID=A0A3D6BTP7_9FLAO|nr:rod shape-determining protein RodA [Xanthomarina sp.]MAL24078.1 rod shape-determining protein RodA [Xanthomarina sp.]MBF61452.1 rod shape-determining protein RodA [Xanthomarina sp.]HAI16677.1 rod shape-determining protein RodA [Xanthomarina gelatinilytica]HCY82582.1 rod shape-determining protein RodA [Xanthomarina gelatinilytica]|tara:strand:+ start:567 stop:1844 length:1278 start_codon:yes stop_codon:yes gene_type:complete